MAICDHTYMADVPVGAVPSPAVAAPASVSTPAAARATKLAAVNAGLAKLASESTAEPKAPDAPAPAPIVDVPVEEKPAEKAPEKPAEPAKSDDDAPDPKTAKSLAAIDKQAKKFRDEQSAAKAELALERAELARLRAEVTGKSSSFEDLQKLAKKDPLAALAKLGLSLDDESEMERVGRAAFPHTKAGKADPRAKPIAEQSAREREWAAKFEEQEAAISELRNEFKTRDAGAQQQRFVNQYLDEAVKAIPAEPSLIGKLHAKTPQKARGVLHALGARMEREAMEADGAKTYDASYTPSHAEVIAQYERERRAELEEQGVDVDALLKPAAKAAPAAPTKTLDPTAVGGTRLINGNPSRAERLAAVTAGIKKLDAAAT